MNRIWLAELIKRRRTRKPDSFHDRVPSSTITELIDLARHAPNHHRTEPARFYLLNKKRIIKLAQLFGELIKGDGTDPTLVERSHKKQKQWSEASGIVVITSLTDSESVLFKKNPNLLEENYATTCCIIQNLLLLFEAFCISAKWSTAEVFNHPEFNSVIGLQSPNNEKFVGFIFYGYSKMEAKNRTLSSLEDHLVNYST